MTLIQAFNEGLRRANDLNEPVVISIVEQATYCDPLAFHAASSLSRAHTDSVNRYYWSCPRPQLTLVGIGECDRFEAHGSDRFNDVLRPWNHLVKNSLTVVLHSSDDSHVPTGTGLLLMGGFSFFPSRPDAQQSNDSAWDGFPDGLMILPHILYTVSDEGAWITYHLSVAPNQDIATLQETLQVRRRTVQDIIKHAAGDPPLEVEKDRRPLNMYSKDRNDILKAKTEWNQLVEAAVDAIGAGTLEKAVVARDVDVTADKPFSPVAALSVLAADYPECFLFSYEQKGRTFVGATPERLVALRGKQVEVTCLAGSTARGTTEQGDERLGQALLNDPKNLFEHNLVISMVKDVLGDRLETMTVAEHPRLLKLKNVQHLFTPVEGTLKADQTDTHIMTLLDALHPTPAVGGFPKLSAMEWLQRHEKFDRGWYAAPVGWMGPEGDGEFVVAIRSALLQGHQGKLFAGCGIVSASVKEAEFEESSMKLLPMVKALERSQP